MPARPRKDGGAAVAVPPREVALAKFAELVMAFPEGDDDGTGIILDILNATDWEDLKESKSELPDARDMVGRDLIFTEATRHVSTIEGGLPFYLIVNAVDRKSGELVRFNTSAASVITKLGKLYALECWPFRGKITKADKPTKAGFYPLDLFPSEVRVTV